METPGSIYLEKTPEQRKKFSKQVALVAKLQPDKFMRTYDRFVDGVSTNEERQSKLSDVVRGISDYGYVAVCEPEVHGSQSQQYIYHFQSGAIGIATTRRLSNEEIDWDIDDYDGGYFDSSVTRVTVKLERVEEFPVHVLEAVAEFHQFITQTLIALINSIEDALQDS